MLQTNDVGILFATMQAAYGHQWAHGADAMPVWQQKLESYTAHQVMQAASNAIEECPDYPPSLGKLIEILKTDQHSTTKYLPPSRYAQPIYDSANADKSWDHMEKLAGKKLRSDE